VGIGEHFELMDDIDAIAKKAGRFVER